MSSFIKSNQHQYDERDYDTSFGDGVWHAIKTSTTFSLALAVFISLIDDKTYYLNTLAYYTGVFFGITVISGIITLMFTFLIAFPMIFLLRHFNLLNDINMAIVGGFITFSTVMFIPRGGFVSFHYVIVFWGMACGYAFMCGYKKGQIK